MVFMSGLDGDRCFLRWSERAKAGSVRFFSDFWRQVLSRDVRFVGKSFSEVVKWQQSAQGENRYLIGDLAFNWIEKKHLALGSKLLYFSIIRAPFRYNRAELPYDPAQVFHSDVAPVDGDFSFDKFQLIVHNSNLMYRCVFSMMFEGVLGDGELIYHSNHNASEIWSHLLKNDGVFKLSVPGRKKSRNVQNFPTFLSAKHYWSKCMREYLRVEKPSLDGVLFVNDRGEPLKRDNIIKYFHARAVEAGVIHALTPECPKCHGETKRVIEPFKARGRWRKKILFECSICGHRTYASSLDHACLTRFRYPVRPHEIRDLSKSRFHVSGADLDVWELQAGHEIDPNKYDKFMKLEPWYPIQEYLRALPWLQVDSDPHKVDRSTIDSQLEGYKTEVETLRGELQKNRLSEDDRAFLTRKDEILRTLERMDKFLKQHG